MKVPPVFGTVARLRKARSAVRGGPRRIDVGPSDLQSWIPWLSKGQLLSPRWLRPLTDELERVLRGEAIEVCVSVPPRHTKSTTIHHWVAMLLAQDPRRRILYCSYDRDFAVKNVSAIRAMVAPPAMTPKEEQVARVRAEAMRRVGVRLPKPRYAGVAIGAIDNSAEFTTALGGGVRAAGVQSPPTGEGYDVVIVDDPIRKLADAMSAKIRETIGDGFMANLYSRRTPGRPASFVVVQTRWHEDDLYGRLKSIGWRCINLPAVLADGSHLAPELGQQSVVEAVRKINPFVFRSLYMGDPSPKEGRLFGDAFFVENPPKDGRRVMGVDISHSAKRRSDRNALCVLLDPGDRDGAYYVEEFVAKRCSLTDRINPSTGRVEETGFVRELAARPYRAAMYTGKDEDLVLNLLGQLDGARANVEARRAEADKRTRAQPAAAAWNDGRIRLPREPWAEEFAARVMAFTGQDGDEDEEVDCLAAAFDLLEEAAAKISGPATSTAHQRLGLTRRVRWT